MRKVWISLHLYTAAFLAPMMLLVATSGGLYLIGVKGQMTQTPVEVSADVMLDSASPTVEAEVRNFLGNAGIEHDFEYIKRSGATLLTRPTSRVHYEFDTSSSPMKVSRNQPDLQKSMIELHKGHGPVWFKNFQKVFAVGLMFVVLSGLWLGLSSLGLRIKTIAASSAGLAIFLILTLVL